MLIKPIPNTLGFSASDTGVIFKPNGEECTQYRNGDGYRTAAVLNKKGQWITFGVQRLVALAHKYPDGDPSRLTVNHVDGDIENNNAYNLEWISVKLNNIHAALMNGCYRFPKILAIGPDGTMVFVSNLLKAAKRFHCDLDTAWGAIRDKRLINGWELKHFNARDKIPEPLRKSNFPARKNNASLRTIPPKAIKMFNVITNETSTYSSMAEAGAIHNVSASHIYQCITKPGDVRLFKKSYLIVGIEEDVPPLSAENIERLMRKGGASVIAYHCVDKKHHIFSSAADFIRYSGLSKKAVTVDLKKDRLRKQGYWIYLYNTSANQERLNKFLGVQTQ